MPMIKVNKVITEEKAVVSIKDKDFIFKLSGDKLIITIDKAVYNDKCDREGLLEILYAYLTDNPSVLTDIVNTSPAV